MTWKWVIGMSLLIAVIVVPLVHVLIDIQNNTPSAMPTIDLSSHYWECINMNGNRINPEPDRCKWACEAYSDSPHMQAHYDEVCRCCNSKGIDYSNAGKYQEQVYVMNADGSRGRR